MGPKKQKEEDCYDAMDEDALQAEIDKVERELGKKPKKKRDAKKELKQAVKQDAPKERVEVEKKVPRIKP